MRSRMGDPNIGRRPTYAEYVQDLIRGDEMNRSEDYTPPIRTYAFYDLDGNGTEELLIFSDDLITSVVGMKNGLTDEGNDLILFGGLRRQTLRGFFDKLYPRHCRGYFVFGNNCLLRIWKRGKSFPVFSLSYCFFPEEKL